MNVTFYEKCNTLLYNMFIITTVEASEFVLTGTIQNVVPVGTFPVYFTRQGKNEEII